MGCDHTYHTEQYSLLEPLPTTSYLYLEKSALKKKNLGLDHKNPDSIKKNQDIVSYFSPHAYQPLLNTLDMLPMSSYPI